MSKPKHRSGFLHSVKKNLPLLVICGTVIAASYWMLFQHYASFSFIGGNDLVYRVESKLLDFRFHSRGAEKPTGKVGILAIDERSLTEFGSFPFPRKFYAQAFDNLKKLGVAWIGFDAIYAEPQEARLSDAKDIIATLAQGRSNRASMTAIENMLKHSPSDQIFADAIRRFQNVVLGYFFFGIPSEAEFNLGDGPRYAGLETMLSSEIFGVVMPDGKTLADYPNLSKAYGLRSNVPVIADASPHFAYFGNDADDDAINRWVTLVANVDGHLMPSLALKTVAEYMNRDIVVFFDDFGVETISLFNRDDESDEIKIPVDPAGVGRILVNHRGPGRSSFHHYSLADAYRNSFSPEEQKSLQGAVLLLGATATGTNDMRPNPFDPSIDGVENHAAVVDNIIAGDYLRRPVSIYETELMIVLAVGLLFAPLMIFGRALLSGFAVIAFAVGYYYFDKYVWFGQGTWAFMAVPAFEIGTMFISTMIYKYMTEEREKKKVKGAFQHYLSPDVINQVLDDPEALKLGGERKELTVYFSDVRGFTTISESLSPEKLVEFMNEYFTPMTDAILKSGGTLDKYIGDAIMAFWGAPLPLPDQADRAAAVAIEHLRRLDVLRETMAKKGFPKPDIGIGLNTGPMSVGNMGSQDRFTYTVMGDAVNLGARLEGSTKEYGVKIIISKNTMERLTPGRFYTRDLDDIRVKGKNEPIKVFELMRPDLLPRPDMMTDLIGHFERGRSFYLQQKWAEAEKEFLTCLNIRLNDGPSNLYLERITEFRKHGPGENWNGVYTFTHK